MDNPFDIAGLKIVVTGASRGIGLNTCNGLVELGASVIGIARSDRPSRLNEKVDYIKFDLSDCRNSGVLSDIIRSKVKSLDGVINVAGISIGQDTELSELERFTKTVEVNLSAVFGLTQELIPLLSNSYGAIVNISSINSSVGFPGNPGYVASKAGLTGLTRAMALDYSKYKIRVNSIAPGYFHTDMTTGSFSDPEKKQFRASKTILGRWGELDELLGPIVFLISPASKYITGIELAVDGGWTAKGM
jgi:NAD(P)-dependent dehydrogenase (short-subunit alcohol dehydrogenase family)